MPSYVGRQHNIRVAVSYIPLDQLIENPRDPQVYTKIDVRRAAKNLECFGAILPLVRTSGFVLLSGNIWLRAAKLAGLTELPTVTVDHLSPAKADAWMVAAAQLVKRGTWNKPVIGEILRDLTLEEPNFDLEALCFDVPEIDLFLGELDPPNGLDALEDEHPPVGPAISRENDLWKMGPHRLLLANSLDPGSFNRLMLGALAAIVFADSPYNVKISGNVSGLGTVKHREFPMGSGEMTEEEFIEFLFTFMNLVARHSADGSLHYLAMDWRHIFEITLAGRRAYDSLENMCVWGKTAAGMGSLYRSQHELFFVFKKGRKPHRNNVQLGRHGRNRTNLWSYPGATGFGSRTDEGDLLKLHPTVKPLSLIVDILLDASARGDIVLDPFMGSGSTLIAAEKIGRLAYGIEIDPLYVDVAVRRWQRWTGESAILEGDGRTFAEITAERQGDPNDLR